MQIKFPAMVPDSEFSETFIQGMADRMAVSFCKYGSVSKAFPEKVDAVATLRLRLSQYEETGNTEFLMDASNYAMIEFMRPRHAGAHYKATDSAESPGRVWVTGATTQQGNTHTSENSRKKIYAREGD